MMINLLITFIFLIINACQAYDAPLGMVSGEIKDWQIKASSSYPSIWDPNCHERFARLYLENGKAWCAKQKSDSEWLQIDLGVAAKVTGVITQGRTGKQEWIVSFMVSYSTDAFQWQYITDRYGNQRVFQGNTDDHALKHNYFDRAIRARFIKFHTIEWAKHPSLRVEIIGTQDCNQLLAVPPYAKFKASSSWPYRNKLSCQPSDGHLMSNKGWCPRRRLTNDQWLELDVSHPTLITGLITKGRGDTAKNHWVTKYKISYSNDSSLWTYYKDANYLEPKEFGGNADKQTERTHFLNNPFVARYIRFHPIQWNEHIGFRAGVLGCPHQDACLPGYFRVSDESNCVENLAYQKEAWTNEKKPVVNGIRNKKNSRSFANILQEGHPSYSVDGDDDNTLQKCTVIDNYYTERPTLVINLGKLTSIGGVIIKTWQGKGQSANFAYRDYMFGLDRFSVFADKRLLNSLPNSNANNNSNNNNSNNNNNNNTSSQSQQQQFLTQNRLRLNEYNLCNFVTRNNYAIFQPQIHLQCTKPLQGRYIYIQADGRTNRWSKLFSAVFCEVQVYEAFN